MNSSFFVMGSDLMVFSCFHIVINQWLIFHDMKTRFYPTMV